MSFPRAWVVSGFILPHAGTATSAASGFGFWGARRSRGTEEWHR